MALKPISLFRTRSPNATFGHKLIGVLIRRGRLNTNSAILNMDRELYIVISYIYIYVENI